MNWRLAGLGMSNILMRKWKIKPMKIRAIMWVLKKIFLWKFDKLLLI
jgi:hypothetical protein